MCVIEWQQRKKSTYVSEVTETELEHARTLGAALQRETQRDPYVRQRATRHRAHDIGLCTQQDIRTPAEKRHTMAKNTTHDQRDSHFVVMAMVIVFSARLLSRALRLGTILSMTLLALSALFAVSAILP